MTTIIVAVSVVALVVGAFAQHIQNKTPVVTFGEPFVLTVDGRAFPLIFVEVSQGGCGTHGLAVDIWHVDA